MWMKIFGAILVILLACTGEERADMEPEEMNLHNDTLAQVLSVDISGSGMNYTFNVEVKSPDRGCDQYADWWEIISLDTVLLYRRILTHSHVDEQPFKRSGGPVSISQSEQVIIRAHMNNLGYGESALKGSVITGFEQIRIPANVGLKLLDIDPLPGDCAF